MEFPQIQNTPDFIYLYSTVRITGINHEGKQESATGFYYSFLKSEEASLVCLVTNKHVLKELVKCEIGFILTDDNGNPNDLEPLIITIIDPYSKTIAHPSDEVDICVLPLHRIVNVGVDFPKDKKLCIFPFDESWFLKGNNRINASAFEEVLMIGYPNGIMDNFNYKPIIRKGITATHIRYDYEDRAEFLIDISCFDGSSGSPVFLYRYGLHEIKDDHLWGPIIRLLGVLSKGFDETKEGKIVMRDLNKAVVRTQIQINLGLVVKIERLSEMTELVIDATKDEGDAPLE